jgi:hypothetical protein
MSKPVDYVPLPPLCANLNECLDRLRKIAGDHAASYAERAEAIRNVIELGQSLLRGMR